MPGKREEFIRKRAFAIWEHANRPEGKELDDWLRAEAEIDGSRGVPEPMNILMEDNMDDEIKRRMDQQDKQISDNRSYIDNISKLLTWYGGGLTIIFGVAAVIFNWNFNSDKTNFNEQISRSLSDITQF
jgi:hypothetical protein